MRDGTNRKIIAITSTHSQTNQNKHEHTHTHNASRGYFPPRHYHPAPAPEHKPPPTAGTFAPWRMVVNPRHRYHRVPHHLPPNKMKAFYESAIEPECPRPAYDPDMDIPEPPAPRRKPPFETLHTQCGQVHTLHGETRLYTGWYTSCGEIKKYAAIGIKFPRREPSVECNRRSAARLLRSIRKGGVC
jgi:hypothetical protein